jgi:hypothetical protein
LVFLFLFLLHVFSYTRMSVIISETLGIVSFWSFIFRHDGRSVGWNSKKREHAISEKDFNVYIMKLKNVACLKQDVRCINIICILCCYNCLHIVSHCVVCSSSIYGFLLPLWYLQTLLVSAISLWDA